MQKTLRNFRRDKRGNTAIVFAMTAIPAVGVASLAIDYGRAMASKAELQAMVDAAALAGARVGGGSDQARTQVATATFVSNLNSGTNPPNITPTITSSGGTVTVTVSHSVATTLAQLVGVTALPFTVQSKASAVSGKQLELSMMIDLTGSMGSYRNGVTKISSLKLAADDLLNILFPNNAQTSDSVRIAVAPFADYVNAGPYAAQATGMTGPLSTGNFVPKFNLANTRQGRTSLYGLYTGVTGNQSGSQAGATSPTGIANAAGATTPTSNTSAGGTFDNGTCSGGGGTPDFYMHTAEDRNLNPWANRTYIFGESIDNASGVTGEVAGIVKLGVPAGNPLYMWESDTYSNGTWTAKWTTSGTDRYVRETSGYGVPMLETAPAGVAIRRMNVNANTYKWCRKKNNGSWTNSWKAPDTTSGDGCNGDDWFPVYPTGDIGAEINSVTGDPSTAYQVKQASNANGYWSIQKILTGGASPTFELSWKTSGWYIPLFESLPAGTPGCEASVPAAQTPTYPLITCVTERTGAQAYTDASPQTAPVGPFNHGSTSIDNYSADGKCWVSGRELPSVIPLTNDKQTLTNFFTNARIGGATPGHIGTAWAWYMISPNWSNVFTGASMPKAYGTPNLIKAAILMTDGEYNIHYASATSRTQALALCQNMKAAGITVYTVGFGFSTTSQPNANGTAEERAKDLMVQCASPGNKYFFPYDGAQLRQDFQAIGAQLMSEMTTTQAKLTD